MNCILYLYKEDAAEIKRCYSIKFHTIASKYRLNTMRDVSIKNRLKKIDQEREKTKKTKTKNVTLSS